MPEVDSRKTKVSASLAVSAALLLILGMIRTAVSLPTRGGTPFDSSSLDLLTFAAWLLALVLTLVMGFTSAHLLCNGPLREARGLRVVIFASGSFMLALLYAANAVGLVYEAQVASPEFRAKFNDFFCDLRGDEICADEGQVRKVLGMAASSDNTTVKLESVTRVRDYCRAKVLNMAYLQMQRATQLQRGHFSADTHSQSPLKDSFNITDAVDKWCGSKAIGRSVNTTSPSSPVSMNPEGYRSLQTQWPDCVKTESIFMGVALVCMAFVCIIDRSGEGKSEQAGDDCKPMKTKMTQEMTTES